jgi:transposase
MSEVKAMRKTYTISPEQVSELAETRRTICDKQTDKRLHAVQLRGEGKKDAAIAEWLETSPAMVSRWVSAYVHGGLVALLPKRRTSHHWNMSYDEEAAFLTAFDEQAANGQLVEVSVIKKAYEERVGHRIGNGQIYRVLARHGFRKIKPRSKHPKKASDEVIEASKKLTPAIGK